MIPEGWKEPIFNEIIKTFTDYVANGSFASLRENVTYSNVEDYAVLLRLKDNSKNYKGDFVYLNKKSYDFLKKSKVFYNDILISNVGARCGFTFRVPNMSKPMTLGPNSVLLRTNQDDNYIYQWLVSDIGQNKIEEIKSTTAQPKFNKTDFKKIKILIPPLPEQKKISSILSSVDEAIQATQKVIDQTQKVKKGLLQEFLNYGDYDQDLTKKDMYILIDLDAVTKRGTGHTPNKKHPEYWNGGIKWVSLADSKRLDKLYITETDKEISEQGIDNSSAVIHEANTVIISRDAGVGKSAILKVNMAVSQHFITWKCSEKIKPLFLYYWLQYMKPVFEQIAIGSTIKTIGMPFFKKLKIPLPTISEQRTFVGLFLSCDKSIQNAQSQKEQLEMLKKGLMQDLLTGKVRVKV